MIRREADMLEHRLIFLLSIGAVVTFVLLPPREGHQAFASRWSTWTHWRSRSARAGRILENARYYLDDLVTGMNAHVDAYGPHQYRGVLGSSRERTTNANLLTA